MTNWQTCSYPTLMALQNDAAKTSLWRSTTIITPRFNGYVTTQNKGKNHVPSPFYKRPQGNYFGENSHVSYGSFGGNGNKGSSSNKGPWDQFKDAKANFKIRAKLYILGINVKQREVLLA